METSTTSQSQGESFPEVDEETQWKDYVVDPRFRSKELLSYGELFSSGRNTNPPSYIRKGKTFSNSHNLQWGGKHTFIISDQMALLRSLSISNVRLTVVLSGCEGSVIDTTRDLYELVHEMELEVGGQRYDRMYSWQLQAESERLSVEVEGAKNKSQRELTVKFPVLFDAFTGNQAFPLLEKHDIKLNLQFALKPILPGYEITETYISYDFVESLEPGSTVMMLQSQFGGAEPIIRGCDETRIRLCFNHPLLWLILSFEIDGNLLSPLYLRDACGSVGLVINGEPWRSWDPSSLRIVGRSLMIPLMDPEFMEDLNPHGVYINAGQIDNLTLALSGINQELFHVGGRDADPQVSVLIGAMGWQQIRFANGMAGLAYSK